MEKGEAAWEISAAGAVVAPGFIDTHSHPDLLALAEPALLPKLMQGITTELLGQDGIGAAPMDPKYTDQWRQYLAGLSGDPPISWDWRGLGQYATRLSTAPTGPNLGLLVPQGNVRMVAMGLDNLQPDSTQIGAMEEQVRKSMEEDALGISLGMVYLPCTFSRRDELVRLFRTSGRLGGFFAVHIRSGGDRLLESVEEVVFLAREAEIPLHISHFKAAGQRNWPVLVAGVDAVGHADERHLLVLELLEDHRSVRGVPRDSRYVLRDDGIDGGGFVVASAIIDSKSRRARLAPLTAESVNTRR